MPETTILHYTRYVLGFLFTPGFDQVILLSKDHGPGQMAGKVNGIGGHVQEGEAFDAAMRREAKEEIGVDVDWVRFCTMQSEEWICDCFTAEVENFENIPRKNDVGEVVHRTSPAYALRYMSVMKNLEWLLPMAMENTGLTAEVWYPAGQRGDR